MARSTSVDQRKPFFFLRFEVLVNGKPTQTRILEDRSDLHMYCTELEVSIELSKLGEEVSNILGKYGILLARVLYGKNFPLFAITFHPPSTVCEVMNKQHPIVNILCPQVSEVIKNHFSVTTSSFLLEVKLDLYLCSPPREDRSVPLISLFTFTNNFIIGVYACLESKVFEFSRLLGSSAASSKDNVPCKRVVLINGCISA